MTHLNNGYLPAKVDLGDISTDASPFSLLNRGKSANISTDDASPSPSKISQQWAMHPPSPMVWSLMTNQSHISQITTIQPDDLGL
jgi:hypothetical protein